MKHFENSVKIRPLKKKKNNLNRTNAGRVAFWRERTNLLL